MMMITAIIFMGKAILSVAALFEYLPDVIASSTNPSVLNLILHNFLFNSKTPSGLVFLGRINNFAFELASCFHILHFLNDSDLNPVF